MIIPTPITLIIKTKRSLKREGRLKLIRRRKIKAWGRVGKETKL